MKPLFEGVCKCQKWVENANQPQLKPIIWYTSWKLVKKWGNRPKKEETDPKKRGNRPKKEEIDQQTENLQLFLKTRNWPKKKRKPINKLRVKNFFWKPETDPKKEETEPKKTGNESNVNIEETDPKYFVFEGFLIILEKRWKLTQNSLSGPFPCWGVSIAP